MWAVYGELPKMQLNLSNKIYIKHLKTCFKHLTNLFSDSLSLNFCDMKILL